MKTLLMLLLMLCCNNISKAQEITLFNSKGDAIAYIADDSDQTIYLFEGKPVAYIDGEDIYGFNGKHLGWWSKGIIRDQKGYAIGAKKGAISMSTNYEPYKGYKGYKPYKSYKEYAPYKPFESSSWSQESLKSFLLKGSSN